MNAAAIEQLATATLNGSMPFPEILGRLMDEGVDFYQVDYRLRQFRFYGVHGDAVLAPLALKDLPEVHEVFDATKLQAAIHDSQMNGQKFRDFSVRAMLAGVQFYCVFLSGKRVMYLGRHGDQHVEWFPGAAPVA